MRIAVRRPPARAVAVAVAAFVIPTWGLTAGASVLNRTTRLASAPGAGASGSPAAASFGGTSADGTRVFFETTESLVAADTNGLKDVYERSGGTTTLVSAPGVGATGSPAAASFDGASADGTRVFFHTTENLVGADTDGLGDVYERSGGTTTLVSAPGVGASGSPASASFRGASADGTRVFFYTDEKLVAADTDVLMTGDVYERSGGTTTLVSAPGTGASGSSASANFDGASADGTRVFFDTTENLVGADTDGLNDVYERSGGTTTLVSAPGAGASSPAADAFFRGASADGTRVFFDTSENLVGADTDGIDDVYERSGGTTTLVSAPGVGASGSPDLSDFGGASADGTRVFFHSLENLVGADTDGNWDVYERSGGTTTLVSAPGVGASGSPAIAAFRGASADGTRVFFDTTEKLVGGDTDSLQDIYERSGGTTTLVSESGTGASGSPATANFDRASADGTRVFFDTTENLVGADTDGLKDVYERSGGTTTLVSAPGVGASGSPAAANFDRASADGTRVFFDTTENLVGADTDGLGDVYEAADLTAPNTTIDSGPSGLINDPTPTFSFSSDEPGATFECKVDGAAYASCTSPKTLSTLADGAHTFKVRAIDPTGNTDPIPASRSFTVDTVSPNTKIKAGPSGATTDRTPTFRFRSSQSGSTFRCKLDSQRYKRCHSPKTYSTLSFGSHTFRVKAKDPAGNTDPTPAKRTFRVVH